MRGNLFCQSGFETSPPLATPQPTTIAPTTPTSQSANKTDFKQKVSSQSVFNNNNHNNSNNNNNNNNDNNNNNNNT